MFQYNIDIKPNFTTDKKTIDEIFKSVSNIVSETQLGTLNIVFVDDYSIQKLNKDYRQIDKVTDVLSFHYFDDFSDLQPDDIA
jgi:ssRNA-specific RNase YbeY (16S rRNA maturation enzyme)